MNNMVENNFVVVWDGGCDNTVPNVVSAIRIALNISRMGIATKVKQKSGKVWRCVAEIDCDQHITFKGKKRTYYNLPLDQYNQPRGDVVDVSMTKAEYLYNKANGMYLMDSYISAVYRALN